MKLGKRAVLLGSLAISLSAAPIIAPKLAAPLDVDAGELLWSELNCSACHHGLPTEGKIAPRTGPVLGEGGLKLTPQSLRAYLTDAQREKPGATMPNLIRDAETVEMLTHFLAPTGEEEKATGASAAKIAQGRRMYHTIGCVACHAPEESWRSVMGVEKADIDPELVGTNSIPLGNLASKLTVDELTKFLRDPVKYRPSGRMPSSNLTGQEAQAIAMYLLRTQASDPKAPSSAPKTLAGLQFEYFEANFGGEPNWDSLKLANAGTTETFNLSMRRREQNFGVRFNGLINIPTSGKITFWTSSDDGSRLFIGDKLVVDNGGEHAPQERSGTIELAAGNHPISLTFYNAGAGHELRVLWQSPGMAKQEIPASVLSHIGQPMLPLGDEHFARDAAKAEKGKALFALVGCAACHQHSEISAPAKSAKSFQNLASGGGCLDADVKAGLPDYHLDSTQRKALQKFLANKASRTIAPSAEAQAWNTLAALNCVACHTRDAKGGPVNARLQYFFANADGDLGDEGRIPPHLTKVGAKLRREWMTEVLEKGAAVRPYMMTRMPQFGSARVGHLPALLEKADFSTAKADPSTTVRDEKFGRRLVGTGGLSCISCHTFAGRKSLGIPAMDLAFMTKRLNYDWFHRYVIDPQALRPGTRMPTFWPNGEAANRDILEGKTDSQINAIWAFLSLSREADLPQGLVTGRKEIVADKEAVIYRNFIRDSGTRSIGVGYPEKANLAFDANELRIAEIWQGSFIDAARHSSGRGEGFEPPLGDRIYKLPAGPQFAKLDSKDSAWPATSKGQMRGYRLDENQRPTFLYSVGGLTVEDQPLAMAGELDSYFSRSLKIQGTQDVWFRAAVGDQIQKQADGTFLVDKKVTFKISGADALVRQSNGKAELIAPLKSGTSEINEEIRW